MSARTIVEEDPPQERVLTYHAKVDPPAGTLMGKGLDGSIWEVQGAIYDQGSNETHVLLQEFVPNYG